MIASQVSLTIRLTLFFLLRNEKIKETCESPDTKNRNVNINRSDAGIAFLKLVSFFSINGPTKPNKCYIFSDDIRKKAMKEKGLQSNYMLK